MDESNLVTIFRLIVLFVLVFINAFFVASEFSLVTIRRTRVEQLVAEGNWMANSVRKAVADPDTFIAATQLGITMASIGLGWIAEPALAHLFEKWLSFLPSMVIGPAAHSVAATIAFATVTFLHIVLGELAPKSLALQRTESTALLVAKPLELFLTLFRPFVWLLNGAGNLVVRALHVPPAGAYHLVHSVEELKMLLDQSREAGVLEEQKEKMLDKVFDFGDRCVLEVMTPRPDIAWLESGDKLSDFLSTFAKTAHRYFPVYKDSIDNVIGVLFIKDVLKAQAEKSIGDEDPIRSLVRPAYFVPETKRIGALFADMQSRGDQIAIVIDEFGGTAGLVTMDQLVTEIVGRVGEELERKEEEFKTIDEKTIEVDGGLHIDDANEELGLDLPSGEYETVAGFILSLLGHIPKEGEQVIHDNLRLVVAEMEGVKIEKVLISRL